MCTQQQHQQEQTTIKQAIYLLAATGALLIFATALVRIVQPSIAAYILIAAIFGMTVIVGGLWSKAMAMGDSSDERRDKIIFLLFGLMPALVSVGRVFWIFREPIFGL